MVEVDVVEAVVAVLLLLLLVVLAALAEAVLLSVLVEESEELESVAVVTAAALLTVAVVAMTVDTLAVALVSTAASIPPSTEFAFAPMSVAPVATARMADNDTEAELALISKKKSFSNNPSSSKQPQLQVETEEIQSPRLDDNNKK